MSVSLCTRLWGLSEGQKPPESYLVTARQEQREGKKGEKGTSSLETLLTAPNLAVNGSKIPTLPGRRPKSH